MPDDVRDPHVDELRERISANDRALIERVNRRLELVAELRHYKLSRGIPFVDRSREESILRELASSNRGLLSDEGLREIVSEILALTKREVHRAEERRLAG